MLALPRFGLDSKTIVGIWPEMASLYVQYMSPMSQNRFLVVSMLPLFILSVLPFSLAYNNIGLVDQLSWVSVLNYLGAGSDVSIFIRILLTIRSNSRIIESEELLL
ncbi:MAG TPA: hypothetical protein DDZ22_12245 [Massilia sp.]|nr:hypothetical protein [Massilia sp.]